MKITDVEVKSIDDSSKYLYPNRSIEIKTTKQDIVTPTRASTDSEYRQKALVPTAFSIENPVSITVEELSANKFDRLMNENGYFARIINRVELKSRLSQYSGLDLVLLKPTKSDKKDKVTKETRYSPMTLLKQNPQLLERFLRVIIKMQQDAGFDQISIPFVELPFQEFSKLVIEVNQIMEKIDRQPIFFVDMDYQDFKKAIDLIANNLQSNVVGLYFQSYGRAHLSYEVLREYIDKDVAFLTVQVERVGLNEIATMHYLPFFGNDIYAVEKPRGFSEKDEMGKPKKIMYSPQRVRLFDKNSLCVRHITAIPSVVERLSEEYSRDPVIPTVLRNFQEATTKDKYEILSAFSKVSELRSSSAEFANFQRYIKQNSAKDYVEEKQVLRQTLQEVAGVQVGTQTKIG
jgi:hypothetical protein